MRRRDVHGFLGGEDRIVGAPDGIQNLLRCIDRIRAVPHSGEEQPMADDRVHLTTEQTMLTGRAATAGQR